MPSNDTGRAPGPGRDRGDPRRPSRRRLLRFAAVLGASGTAIAGLGSALWLSGSLRKSRRGPTIPMPRPELPGWLRDHDERVARAMAGRDRLVFLGDSITLGWLGKGGPPYAGEGLGLWRRLYDPRGASVSAVGADRVEHLLWRVRRGEVVGPGPLAVVLLIGTNNIGIDPPGAIAQGIEAVVDSIRRRCPGTSILVMALPPRGDPLKAVPRLDRVRPHPDVASVNRLIAPLDRLPRVRLLDFGDRLLDPDGLLSRSVSPDFLHFRRPAYDAWAASIEPTLQLLLGPPSVP